MNTKFKSEEELTEAVRRWAESEEGRREIAEMNQRARRSADVFRRARRINPKWLRIPMTI